MRCQVFPSSVSNRALSYNSNRLPQAQQRRDYHRDSSILYGLHLYDSDAMNATPRRVTGAYPATPGTNIRGRAPPTPPTDGLQRQTPPRQPQQHLPEAPLARGPEASAPDPVIPLNVLDAPTQRFYAFGVYVVLLSWKLYNWVTVVEDGAESFWLGLKWAFIDIMFIFGLPELRIPWLEPSWGFMLFTSIAHVIFDFVLMLNIGVSPVQNPHISGCVMLTRSSFLLALLFLPFSEYFGTVKWPSPNPTSKCRV